MGCHVDGTTRRHLLGLNPNIMCRRQVPVCTASTVRESEKEIKISQVDIFIYVLRCDPAADLDELIHILYEAIIRATFSFRGIGDFCFMRG